MRDGNRDRQFWITDNVLDAHDQQKEGVRMSAFVRSHIRANQFAKVLHFVATGSGRFGSVDVAAMRLG